MNALGGSYDSIDYKGRQDTMRVDKNQVWYEAKRYSYL
jgi:hypothetical protein